MEIPAGTRFFSLTIKAKSNIIEILIYLVAGTILFAEGRDLHLGRELVNQITLDFGL